MTNPTPPPANGSIFSETWARARKQHALHAISDLEADERHVLQRLVAGWGTDEIVRELGIDEEAYCRLRERLFRRIDARVTADAVRIGIYAGLDR